MKFGNFKVTLRIFLVCLFHIMFPLTNYLSGINLGPSNYTFLNNSKFFCVFSQRLGKSLTMALNSNEDTGLKLKA